MRIIITRHTHHARLNPDIHQYAITVGGDSDGEFLEIIRDLTTKSDGYLVA
jgi:hypothetical protein